MPLDSGCFDSGRLCSCRRILHPQTLWDIDLARGAHAAYRERRLCNDSRSAVANWSRALLGSVRYHCTFTLLLLS